MERPVIKLSSFQRVKSIHVAIYRGACVYVCIWMCVTCVVFMYIYTYMCICIWMCVHVHVQYPSDTRYKARVNYTRLHGRQTNLYTEANTCLYKVKWVYTRRQTPFTLEDKRVCLIHVPCIWRVLYIYVHVLECVCTCTCVYVYMCTYMYVAFVCTNVCLHVCACACTYIHVQAIHY